MAKPNKDESKQKFLNRCTRDLIDGGKNSDEAYAQCNLDWDQARNSAGLSLSSMVMLQKTDDKQGGKRAFMITAYTGQKIDRWYGGLIIDVAGMSAKESMPILREHERDRVVGHSKKAWADQGKFFISGDMSEATPDGKEVTALADEGFPWQASVGVWAKKIESLEDENVTAEVNGQMVTGPIDIWRESLVGETSFCVLGADDRTAAIVLSEDGPVADKPIIIKKFKEEDLTMKITLAMLQEQEPQLLAEIRAAAKAEVTIDSFKAQTDMAIATAVTAERLRVNGIFEGAYGKDMAAKFAKIVDPACTMADMMSFAEEKAKADMLAKLTAAAPESLGAGNSDAIDSLSAMPEGEEKWKAEYAKSKELQEELGSVEIYVAYKKAESEGRVKILKNKQDSKREG
jgi:hypothetical protein